MKRFATFPLLLAVSCCASVQPRVVHDFCALTGGPPPVSPATVEAMTQDEVDWTLALQDNGAKVCGWSLPAKAGPAPARQDGAPGEGVPIS